jgi:hypothetical protein
MVPTFKSKTLITDLYSMNPPDSRGLLLFEHPINQMISVDFPMTISKCREAAGRWGGQPRPAKGRAVALEV